MFHDIQNQLMVKEAVATAVVVSTDVYDFVKAGTDQSIGRMLAALFVPTIAATGGATYTLEVIQSTVAGMTSPDVIATRVATAAELKVDALISLPIPQGSISKEFIAFRVTPVGGTTPTVTLSAYLVPLDEIPVNKQFAKVYTTI